MARKQTAPPVGANRKVEITRGTIKILCTRADVVTVDSSHDGIVFQMTNGLNILITDQFMPQETKERIRVGVSSFPESDIKINLNQDKYQSPIMCDLGKVGTPNKKEDTK